MATNRYTPHKKAAILAEIESGAITREEAREQHGLSEEEIYAWQRDFAKGGVKGLAVKNVQRGRRRK